MKPIRCLPDTSLRFHIEDAERAISAKPDNAKVPQYFDEAHRCRVELQRRARLRTLRSVAKWLPGDPLLQPLRFTRFRNCIPQFLRTRDGFPVWRKQDAMEALHSIAFLTLTTPKE